MVDNVVPNVVFFAPWSGHLAGRPSVTCRSRRHSKRPPTSQPKELVHLIAGKVLPAVRLPEAIRQQVPFTPPLVGTGRHSGRTQFVVWCVFFDQKSEILLFYIGVFSCFFSPRAI